eukprot:Sdes_comp18182_c0_seq1m7704
MQEWVPCRGKCYRADQITPCFCEEQLGGKYCPLEGSCRFSHDECPCGQEFCAGQCYAYHTSPCYLALMMGDDSSQCEAGAVACRGQCFSTLAMNSSHLSACLCEAQGFAHFCADSQQCSQQPCGLGPNPPANICKDGEILCQGYCTPVNETYECDGVCMELSTESRCSCQNRGLVWCAQQRDCRDARFCDCQSESCLGSCFPLGASNCSVSLAFSFYDKSVSCPRGLMPCRGQCFARNVTTPCFCESLDAPYEYCAKEGRCLLTQLVSQALDCACGEEMCGGVCYAYGTSPCFVAKNVGDNSTVCEEDFLIPCENSCYGKTGDNPCYCKAGNFGTFCAVNQKCISEGEICS